MKSKEEFFLTGGGGKQIGIHNIHRFTGLKFLWIRRLELCLVERNYSLGDKLTLSLADHVPTDRKSLSSCVLRVQKVNEVTALTQHRALWSAE